MSEQQNENGTAGGQSELSGLVRRLRMAGEQMGINGRPEWEEVCLEAVQEIENLRSENAQLQYALEQGANCTQRYRIKMNDTHGQVLNGHWFWIVPADEYAKKALDKLTPNVQVSRAARKAER